MNLQHFGSEICRFNLDSYISEEDKKLDFTNAVKNSAYRYAATIAKEIGADYVFIGKINELIGKKNKLETIANFYVKN